MELQGLVAGDVLCDALHLAMYSTDASIYQIMPTCVVLPRDEEDVARVVRYAGQNGISVIPRGGGSGLAGETVGAGIVLDMSRYPMRDSR